MASAEAEANRRHDMTDAELLAIEVRALIAEVRQLLRALPASGYPPGYLSPQRHTYSQTRYNSDADTVEILMPNGEWVVYLYLSEQQDAKVMT